jgi:hypothetical protein
MQAVIQSALTGGRSTETAQLKTLVMRSSMVTTSTEQITSTKTSGVMPTSYMVDEVMEPEDNSSMVEMATIKSTRVTTGVTAIFTAKKVTIHLPLEKGTSD